MTDNDNLELKKRSRRRLVGAAALALLAAIVLPMVMDQEPGSPTQDIHVSIPDRDAENMAARPIAGRAATPAEPQVAPPPVEQAPGPATAPDPAVPITPNASSATAPSAPAASAPVPPVIRPPASSAAGTSTTEEAGGKPAPSTPPAPAVAKDEAARVRALLEGQASAAAAPRESYVVQVGAFGEAAKAASLSSELKSRGFAAYTEKAGSVTRVRVGPFANKEQAEKAAERLRANGLNGVVAAR